MRLAIVRRTPGASFSMDVYADNLVAGLKAIRPEWEIVEVHPKPWNSVDKLWQSGTGIRRYYERFWHHPQEVSRLKADLYHIIDHTNAHVAYWLKKLGKPIVVTCHDLVHFKYPEIIREQSRFPFAAPQFATKQPLPLVSKQPTNAPPLSSLSGWCPAAFSRQS